jgi:YjbE family integral membrane protein
MSPEPLSAAWLSALASIVVIDLILAGDNAIVIGLAARNVPVALRRKVILWGTAGAIVVRALLTLVVVWLLRIPGFLAVGGIALAWIGWKLTRGGGEAPQEAVLPARGTLGSAIRTIVVADAVMGVDNVLAVGGAAHGSFVLVVIGLMVSIPIVIWGSTMVLKWVERVPALLWIGAGVLGFTAAKMIASEPFFGAAFAAQPWLRFALYVVVVGALVGVPVWRSLAPPWRTQLLALAVLVAWLAAWGALDARLASTLDPTGAWQWDESLADFVRWVGWIPLVVALMRARRRAGHRTLPPG